MTSLRTELHQVSSDACDGTMELTAPQLKDILKLVLSAVRQTKRISSSAQTVTATWEPSKWANLGDKLSESKRFGNSKGLSTMCKQIAQVCQTSTSAPDAPEVEKKKVGKKRKAHQVNGVAEGKSEGKEEKKTKKRKS